MFFYEDSHQAADYLRQAVPLMVKHKIVPNPCNFALWYAYVSGKNKTLNKALDDAINSTGTCSAERSIELFVQHIIGRDTEDQQTQESLQALVENLFSGLEEAIAGTKDYDENLQKGLQNLQSSSEQQDIENTIQDLIQNTKVAAEIGQTFHKQLDAAQEEIQSLKSQLETSKDDAFKDPLTKLGNRRFFDTRLQSALINNADSTSLMIIDLDHFKRCNDTYGHIMGDKILQSMGVILNEYNTDDVACARYGGEEFAIIMKNSPLDEAAKMAESIRQKISQLQIRQNDKDSMIDSLSASIGVAEYIAKEHPENFIERADKALYAAKEGGRNQVQCAR
jgi:diguanylate cyclase